jgi:transcription elongation GreA/GreB family factor
MGCFKIFKFCGSRRDVRGDLQKHIEELEKKIQELQKRLEEREKEEAILCGRIKELEMEAEEKVCVKNQVEDNLSVPTNSVVTFKEKDCEMDAHQTIDKDELNEKKTAWTIRGT